MHHEVCLHRMCVDIIVFWYLVFSSAVPRPIWCRICQQHSDEPVMELGCHCRGELAKAHRSCIEQWFGNKGTNKCEVCQCVFFSLISFQCFRLKLSFWVVFGSLYAEVLNCEVILSLEWSHLWLSLVAFSFISTRLVMGWNSPWSLWQYLILSPGGIECIRMHITFAVVLQACGD